MAGVGQFVEKLVAHEGKMLHVARRASIAMIMRARRQGDPWSGHIAFPGGRSEPEESKFETAIRETQEEIGLDLRNGFRFLSQLDDMTASYHGRRIDDFSLSSFVFLQVATQTPSLNLCRGEVDATFWVPLSALGLANRRLFNAYAADRHGSSVDPEPVERPAIEVAGVARDFSFAEPAAKRRWTEDTPMLWGLSFEAVSRMLEVGGVFRLDSNATASRPDAQVGLH